MTNEQVVQFKNAADAAGLTKYQFDTDLGTHLHHDGVNNFVYIDTDMAWNFRAPWGGSTPGYNGVNVIGADYADIHEVRIGGNADQITQFAESLGLSLTEEMKNIIVKIDRKNFNIIPQTGDYVQFKELTSKEVENLSPEKREKYLQDLANYNATKNNLVKGSAGQITV